MHPRTPSPPPRAGVRPSYLTPPEDKSSEPFSSSLPEYEFRRRTPRVREMTLKEQPVIMSSTSPLPLKQLSLAPTSEEEEGEYYSDDSGESVRKNRVESKAMRDVESKTRTVQIADDWDREMDSKLRRKRRVIDRKKAKRRRKLAHGSCCWRYCTTRLHLRVLVVSTAGWGGFLLGALAFVGLWAFFVFGRPPSSLFWTNSNSKLGGTLNTSLFCEQRRVNEFTKQAAGGFSTVTYAIVGWLFIWLWFLDFKHNTTFEARFGNLPASIIVRSPAWSFLFGSSLLFLSIGAWLRHASLSKVGQRLETTGYWTVLLGYASCSVARMVDAPIKLRTKNVVIISQTISFVFVFVAVGVDIAFGIRMDYLEIDNIPQVVFGTLATIALVPVFIHWRMHRLTIESEVWLLVIGLVFFIVGFAVTYSELALCISRTSFAQPYAFGHVLNATSMLFVYFFLRSDMWKHGDGAETAPGIRPFRWGVLFCREFREQIGDACSTKEVLAERISQRRRTRSGRRVMLKADGSAMDEDGREVMFKRLATYRSLASVWTPELRFTQKQIRVAEMFCGLILTAAIVAVIYLALA